MDDETAEAVAARLVGVPAAETIAACERCRNDPSFVPTDEELCDVCRPILESTLASLRAVKKAAFQHGIG